MGGPPRPRTAGRDDLLDQAQLGQLRDRVPVQKRRVLTLLGVGEKLPPAGNHAGVEVARIGQALASRTYGELAAVTAGIPAELIGALPRRPPVRARRRIPFNTAVTGGACMAGMVNAGMVAVLLSRSPVAVVLFVVLTVIGTILVVGAMIVAR